MTRPPAARPRTLIALAALAILLTVPAGAAPPPLPELTAPVNDFAGLIDAADAASMDRTIRALQSATGDAVVVATVKNTAGYGDIQEYAVKLFENGGRGIGQKGKDNGVLILLSQEDRRVWIEVGYDLEGVITDGYAGETSREYMVPHFRQGDYGAGLDAGVQRIVGRIADARHVTLTGVKRPEPAADERPRLTSSNIFTLIVIAIIVIRILGAASRANRFGRRRRGPWSGWTSGIGPFGGGFGGGWGSGGGGGGGFGGGFGGFGGGRSGGGGGGASW
jgi:uncharacterized protein